MYDAIEQDRVYALLNRRGVDMPQIDFFVAPTDDVWATRRNNGPIFAYDRQTNDLVVEDWRNKADYWLDNAIPGHVSRSLGLPLINVNMVNEGGSFEVDGCGTFMAKKSSVINSNRNRLGHRTMWKTTFANTWVSPTLFGSLEPRDMTLAMITLMGLQIVGPTCYAQRILTCSQGR